MPIRAVQRGPPRPVANQVHHVASLRAQLRQPHKGMQVWIFPGVHLSQAFGVKAGAHGVGVHVGKAVVGRAELRHCLWQG